MSKIVDEFEILLMIINISPISLTSLMHVVYPVAPNKLFQLY